VPFQIIRNDITRVKADVIVNTANPKPVIGDGTDSAIYRAAGEEALLAERVKIGDIAPGQAAATPAFNLPAKYIIHTVGPVWIDGNHNERETLRDCYDHSLSLAAELKAESIAFPLISTGVYRFPKDEALDIATDAIGKFLLTHEMNVTLVVFNREAFVLSRELIGEIDQYIDEHGVALAEEREYGGMSESLRRRMNDASIRLDMDTISAPERMEDILPCEEDLFSAREEQRPAAKEISQVVSLDDMIQNTGKSFQQKLFDLIDEKEMDDVTVYKGAYVSRKVFSSIRCKKDYKPKKQTAIALGLALHLNMSEMEDLLARAGFAFSPSSKSDLIIQFCIHKGIYDLMEVDKILFKYKQPTLSSDE